MNLVLKTCFIGGVQLKETSIFGDIADWMNGLIHAIKEPKMIDDGKFIRPNEKMNEKTIVREDLKEANTKSSI